MYKNNKDKNGHSFSLPRFPDPVEPSSAKCERAEMLVDGGQELLGSLEAKGNMAHVEVLHVMAALHVLVNDANFKG